MTTQQRIGEFLKRYAKHLDAQRRNDPFSSHWDAPNPDDYGLTGPAKQVALQQAEKLHLRDSNSS